MENLDPPKDLAEDIAAIHSLLDEAIGDGNDVVVVAHSWGGIVAGSALAGYSVKEREASSQKGGVVRALYIAAFIVDQGVSLLDCVGGDAPPWSRVEVSEPAKHDGFPSASSNRFTDALRLKGRYIYSVGSPFYEDLPDQEQQVLKDALRPHAWDTFRKGATAASWLKIPTSYLLCEKDQAIPGFAQEATVKNAEAKGGVIEVTRLASSHSPFLSRLDETVDWFREVAGGSW